MRWRWASMETRTKPSMRSPTGLLIGRPLVVRPAHARPSCRPAVRNHIRSTASSGGFFRGPLSCSLSRVRTCIFVPTGGGGVGEALKARNRVAHLAGDPTELSDHHEHGRQSPEGGGVSEPKRSIPVAVAGQVISSLLTMPLLDVRNERATCQHAARASLQAANSQRW